ncbi:MAG TPA: hypothetical protein VN644_04045 [Pyrinomonadaceae bacterium]|nr:hypothetical protein [Pyrinomonadaceae bacterium]
MKFSTSNANKLDLILLILQRLQEDLQMAKRQIKTSIREVKNEQNYITDSLTKLRRNTEDINDRLHGLELNQDRQNSST